MSKTANFIGVPCRKMPPTLKHRPAIWEGILGTVYAMNDNGAICYFDYDWDDAKVWAGIANKKDIRLYRNKQHVRWSNDHSNAIRWSNGVGPYSDPKVGKLVLWVEK